MARSEHQTEAIMQPEAPNGPETWPTALWDGQNQSLLYDLARESVLQLACNLPARLLQLPERTRWGGVGEGDLLDLL